MNSVYVWNLAFWLLAAALVASACRQAAPASKPLQVGDMMIRIAELEIDSLYLEEYLAILKEEAAASLRLEPGVICIYPMYQQQQPAQVRILEIYASREAYEAHLKSPHFLKYKTSTLNMVKSLRLVDMQAIDAESMPEIFLKLKPLNR